VRLDPTNDNAYHFDAKIRYPAKTSPRQETLHRQDEPPTFPSVTEILDRFTPSSHALYIQDARRVNAPIQASESVYRAQQTRLKMPRLTQYDYVFAIGTFFAMLDAFNNGASEWQNPGGQIHQRSVAPHHTAPGEDLSSDPWQTM
jgi:hypothetical protein